MSTIYAIILFANKPIRYTSINNIPFHYITLNECSTWRLGAQIYIELFALKTLITTIVNTNSVISSSGSLQIWR
jgi:hypothetical protein